MQKRIFCFITSLALVLSCFTPFRAFAATEEISPGGALMAGPYHAAFGELCMGEVFRRKMSGLLAGDSAAVFAVNPKDISKVIGNGGRNIAAFAEKNIKIEIKQDCAIKRGELVRLDK